MNKFKVIYLMFKSEPLLLILLFMYIAQLSLYFIATSTVEKIAVIVFSILFVVSIVKLILIELYHSVIREYNKKCTNIFYGITSKFVNFDYVITIYLGKEFYNVIKQKYSNSKKIKISIDKTLKKYNYRVIIDESFQYKNNVKQLFYD